MTEKKNNAPKVILLGSGDRRPKILPQVEKLRAQIASVVEIVEEDFAYAKDLSAVEADFAIVFGGDGSILRAAKQMGLNQIPVLGVNLGKLGYLADIHPDEVLESLKCVVDQKHSIVNHLMIHCKVFHNKELVSDQIGLNEVAILGGPPFDIQQIELYVDQEHATSYLCDGLIVSTPVGSTAHNLSAGGPILRKNLQAFVIAPISPHTLTVRPVVDTADRTYEIVVSRPNESTCVVLDGQVLSKLGADHRVEITKADSVFQMVQVAGNSYYGTLREKLGWSGNFHTK